MGILKDKEEKTEQENKPPVKKALIFAVNTILKGKIYKKGEPLPATLSEAEIAGLKKNKMVE